jgi:hypothetical protein
MHLTTSVPLVRLWRGRLNVMHFLLGYIEETHHLNDPGFTLQVPYSLDALLVQGMLICQDRISIVGEIEEVETHICWVHIDFDFAVSANHFIHELGSVSCVYKDLFRKLARGSPKAPIPSETSW